MLALNLEGSVQTKHMPIHDPPKKITATQSSLAACIERSGKEETRGINRKTNSLLFFQINPPENALVLRQSPCQFVAIQRKSKGSVGTLQHPLLPVVFPLKRTHHNLLTVDDLAAGNRNQPLFSHNFRDSINVDLIMARALFHHTGGVAAPDAHNLRLIRCRLRATSWTHRTAIHQKDKN